MNTIMPPAADNQGWTAVDTVIIRFNTSLTPSGSFPVYSDQPLPNHNATQNRIGYDAAVCLQRYEPWITEAYHASTGSTSALRVVEKGGGSISSSPSGNIRGAPISNTRYLNTTGKDAVFPFAHAYSYGRMLGACFNKGETWSNYAPLLSWVPPCPLALHFF